MTAPLRIVVAPDSFGGALDSVGGGTRDRGRLAAGAA